MRPSGWRGDDGVRGERGEWDELYCGSSGRSIFRGGNGTSYGVVTACRTPSAGISHLVNEHNLKRLRLVRLPYRDLALREERVAEPDGEDQERVLARGRLGRGGRVGSGARWCLRGLSVQSRIKSGDEHDGCELHE